MKGFVMEVARGILYSLPIAVMMWIGIFYAIVNSTGAN